MELTRLDWIVLHVRRLWRNRHYRWRLARSHVGGVWLIAGVLVAFMGQFKSLIQQARRLIITGSIAGWIVANPGPCRVLAATGGQTPTEVRIVELQGTVEVLPKGAVDWVLTQTNQILRPLARLRTGPNSRVALWWSDQSVAAFNEQTEIEILPPHEPESLPGLHLIKGLFSFLHRDKPGRIRVVTRGAVAGVEGTEFVLAVDTVDNTERTTLSLIDGRVRFTNLQGERTLTNGQQAVAEPGRGPVLTAGFIANNVLQWAFYYPAVLDLSDLALPLEAKDALRESLAAYSEGDLLTALARYPPRRQPGSDAERVYYAALLLSVGQVDKTEAALEALPAANPSAPLPRLANALRTLIAAVKLQPAPLPLNPQLATEFLACSYYEQSRAVGDPSLRSALAQAKQAVALSPGFSFAWARVAELEFSFGHTGHALDALNESLELSTRNAQALALKGFLLAAQNKTRDALDWFNQALAVDSALGNAWLGRGLCRIRRGDTSGGREDLLIAAALEPQRALLRSYLGKAYGQAGDIQRALHELDLAKRLDPKDPTPWLYSAFLNREQNRINDSVREVEESIELNENRALYRSRFLLDEDRAMRSSSLADLYQGAGMDQVALREAARAVSYDYANYSGHLFLSESYNALRDPTRFNLRYETVWFNELLLANLLSHVGGTPLSPNISQQEYSRLFERDRIGLASSSEYRSDGQYRQLASQYGVIGNSSWSLDLDYQHNDGVRPNNELDRIEWYTTVKQQLTPQDSVLLLAKYQDYHSGDNFQYYDPRASVRPNFTYDESQHPILLAGYHRAWRPGVHTLLLGGRLENDQRFTDRGAGLLTFYKATDLDPAGPVTRVYRNGFDVDHRTEIEIYTAEIQQVFDSERQTLLLGGRWQQGQFDTRSDQTNPTFFTNDFATPPAGVRAEEDFHRGTVYGYYTLKLPRHLSLTGGAAYEHLRFPRNFRSPPISEGEETRERVTPKAALVWSPLTALSLRGAYTCSLGGVSLDESYRLEPTQLAGFSQSFRSVIPESLVGSVSAPKHETWDTALDLKLKTGTYIGLHGELLRSKVEQTIGVFDEFPSPPAPGLPRIVPSSTRQHLDFEQHSAGLVVNQLLADHWSLGAFYRFTRSELDTAYPALRPEFVPGDVWRKDRADLHQAGFSLLFSHPAGPFARFDLKWYFQDSSFRTLDPSGLTRNEVETRIPGDEFPHLDLFIGYRFPRRRAELVLGVLNLTDQDYRLNPLNAYPELPRERVFLARLNFRF